MEDILVGKINQPFAYFVVCELDKIVSSYRCTVGPNISTMIGPSPLKIHSIMIWNEYESLNVQVIIPHPVWRAFNTA